MSSPRFRAIPLVLLLAAACADQELTFPDRPPTGGQPGSGTNLPGFYWLPPMVKAPAGFTGSFDPGRHPVARVVCVKATGTGCPVLATFDASTAPPGRLTVDLKEESYSAVWLATGGLLSGSGRYRLIVEENGTLLGMAALRVVGTQADVRTVPADEIALVRGKPFVIKFRLEKEDDTDPDPEPVADPLPVPPDTPIRLAIPDLRFVPEPGDYTDDHPEAPGLLFSPSVLTLSLEASATAGQVNQLLRPLGVRVVGGAPFPAGTPSGGFLIVRLPTATHAAMESALAILRASPLVRAAVQNHPVNVGSLPTRSAVPGLWTWETVPGTGNWAFEVARLPQMWHLNQRVAATGRRPTVLVADRTFWPSHEDVTYESLLTPDSMIVRPGLPNGDYHGTMVASVMGATWGNGRGQDGANPFVRMAAMNIQTDGTEVMVQLKNVLMADLTIRVLNQSWGLRWRTTTGGLVGTAAFRTATADQAGQQYYDMLTALVAAGRPLPHIIASAGNDGIDARFNGYAQNAAVRLRAAPITVVEAMAQTGPAGALGDAGFSNRGGHVSAGGARVQVAGGSNSYSLADGTSFAAPLVTGVVSFLTALDSTIPLPTMTTNPMRDLLIASGREVATVRVPVVDGFAALLALDQRSGNEAFARELADLDDGTADGNERVRADGTVDTTTAAARDGRVDMRDFRRFRDWYLQVTGNGQHLNGASDHPKKDLNGDGIVGTALVENVYPRGDLNGDGVLDNTPRPFGKGGPMRTDLQVLSHFFSDPDYDAADLPNLLESGDIHIDPSSCSEGAVSVTTVVEVDGIGEVRRVTHATPSAVAVATVVGLGTSTPYNVTVFGVDGSGREVFRESDQGIVVERGSDHRFRPSCECPEPTAPRPAGMLLGPSDCATLSITPSSTRMVPGDTRRFLASVWGAENAAVTWTASRGTISGTGRFTAPSTVGPVTIVATLVEDPAVRAEAQVSVEFANGGGALLQVSPAVAAVGYGQNRAFSVIGGSGSSIWSTDREAGTISGGLFTAGQTEGEFGVYVTSANGGGMAKVIVDRYAGVYEGAVVRNTVSSNRTWSIARYSVPPQDQRCRDADLDCYFTGGWDFGQFGELLACYFQVNRSNGNMVGGYCDYSTRDRPLSLEGNIGGRSVGATIRSVEGDLVITVGMTKR